VTPSRDSRGDLLTSLLGDNLDDFLRVEDQLPSLADALAESHEDDPFGAEPETNVARGLAAEALRTRGIRAGEALQAVLDHIEAARDKLDGIDGDAWTRVDRVAGVFAEALSFVEEAAVAVDDDGLPVDPGTAGGDLPVHAPGWRPSDFRAADAAADEPPTPEEQAMMGDDQC